MPYMHPEYLIETDWLQTHLDDPNLRVIDCTVYLPNYFDESAAQKIEIINGHQHWREGHIPGSTFADLTAELRDHDNHHFMFPTPTAEQFTAAMARYGVGDGTRVVLYDDLLNAFAARVWWMFRTFGFSNVAILNGGWKKWVAEGRPVSTETTTYPPTHFTPRYQPDRIATKQDVLAAIDSEAVCLVNGLDRDEHAGRGPVRYGRAGHIPSSLNLPFIGVVDPATSTYLPPDDLAAFVAQSGITGKHRIITYCGGANAASSAAFALALLGVENVALYDGSLFEWAADPSLPLVTGDVA